MGRSFGMPNFLSGMRNEASPLPILDTDRESTGEAREDPCRTLP